MYPVREPLTPATARRCELVLCLDLLKDFSLTLALLACWAASAIWGAT